MNALQARKYTFRNVNGKQQIGVRAYTMAEVRALFDASYTVIKRHYETPCWEWLLPLQRKGYGEGIVFNGRRWNAHQTSWILHSGEIPAGLFVCHHCDNPKCVNPSHLFVSDNDGNMKDAHEKGRCIGEGHYAAVLTESDVKLMRHLRETEGTRYIDLAARFRVHKQTVAGIIRRERWQHI